MMPLACLGSPQDTLTEVVVNSLKWMKLGTLGAFDVEREVMTVGSIHSAETKHYIHCIHCILSSQTAEYATLENILMTIFVHFQC